MKQFFITLLLSVIIIGDFMGNDLKIRKIIDLTHVITSEIPTWDNSCGFVSTTILDYSQCKDKTKFKIEGAYFKKCGTGTHIDTPSHCFSGRSSAADLQLETLITKAYVIDVSTQSPADYLISHNDIITFEKQYGKIQENSLIIFYTGWSRYWPDIQNYRNEDAEGNMHFPTLSIQAAELLLERNIVGIAIDTLSPDSPTSGFPVHRLLLDHNKYIIENIANCDQLPNIGAYIIALPIKAHLTESPLRIVGLILEN